jgi:O-antigen/teichoic acid export membrane protein
LNKIKQLASESLLYGLGNMVPRLLNFLLFPIHTQVFKPEEYGVFTYLMSAVAVLNVIYTFGMETSYFRFASKPGANENKVFNQALTSVFCISGTLSLLFILASSSMASLAGVPDKPNYIVWLSLILFIDNIVSIPFARLRLQKKPKQFAFYRVTNVLILTGLSVYFLFFNYDPLIGIEYIFWANLIANSFYLLFFLHTFLKWRPSLDREMFPEMARYAYPIMFTGIAGMMNEFFSRLALENWLPKDFYPGKSSGYAVGVFGATYKFSVIMQLTVQAFRMAGEPFFFNHAHDKNSPELFARVNHYFVIVCCFILLAVSINTDVLKYIFLRQEEYWEAIAVVPPLLLGYLFLGIYYNLSVWFKVTDKTYMGTFITLGGAVLTVVLNLALIPFFGYMGSSWATAIVYGTMVVVCYYLGQKNYPIPYHVRADLSYIVITVGLVYLIQQVAFQNQWSAIGFHFLFMAVYLLAVYFIESKRWREVID